MLYTTRIRYGKLTMFVSMYKLFDIKAVGQCQDCCCLRQEQKYRDHVNNAFGHAFHFQICQEHGLMLLQINQYSLLGFSQCFFVQKVTWHYVQHDSLGNFQQKLD